MSINELITVSRKYGSNPDFVVAGGGNTSWKTAGELYIKGSGFALETITEAGFVRMDRRKLAAIWTASYPSGASERESAVLSALMASRHGGEEAKRPSVETLLHDVLPYAFVVHTHPALVNGLTCSARGEQLARELFGDDMLWIPSTNPGYILSKIVKDAYAAHAARTGTNPSFILLQNHGIFVAADTVAGIDKIYDRVMAVLAARVVRKADFSPVADAAVRAKLAESATALLAKLATTQGSPAASSVPAAIHFGVDTEIARLVSTSSSFAAVASPFSPDHIVYAGSDFVFAESVPDLEKAYAAFAAKFKRAPKLAAVKGLGVFGIGSLGNEKSARLAVELFRDAAKIAAYVESFGGPRYMTTDQIEFINTWEVEQYRSKISTGNK